MGRRREEALQEIAVRRARALSAYVVCNDLDPEVIESLRRDSLVNSPDGNLSLVATAHAHGIRISVRRRRDHF